MNIISKNLASFSKRYSIVPIASESHILPVAIIILTALLTFWNITDIFFQQDEWLGLGNAITRSETGGISKLLGDLLTPTSQLYRFLPMTAFLNMLVFNLFGTNTSYYGVLAFTFLTINSILIYVTIHKLVGTKLVGLITSLLWMTNNLSYQAATWISTMTPSQPSFLFFMISIYLLIDFLQSPGKTKSLVLSAMSIMLSLFFKENSAFYVFVFVMLIWLFTPKMKTVSKIKTSVLVVVPLFITLLIPKLIITTNSSSVIPVSVQSASINNVIYNAFLLPARSLYQVLFPYTETYKQILNAKAIHYPDVDSGVIENLVADSYLMLAAFWLLFAIFISTLIAEDKFKKLIIFTLVSFFASTLPFILYENKIAFIEQRYFMFPALWSALLVTICVYSLFRYFPKIRKQLMLLVFIPMIYVYGDGIRQKLNTDIYIGNYRKEILNTVSKVKPDLSESNIFYFFTDNTGFWEFQSGFGQTLAVWLYDSGKIPREALSDLDFWDSSYEGLKEYGSRKYGYFMTYDKLVDSLNENKEINLGQVHAYYWDYQKHTVTNVSEEIRTKLSKDITLAQ